VEQSHLNPVMLCGYIFRQFQNFMIWTVHIMFLGQLNVDSWGWLHVNSVK
jgi:hypothetical protein